MSTLLEVCVDSVESAIAARDGGADRLEVCAALATGGTTPSFGFVKRCVAEIQLPLMMMIRPHDGGFVYQEGDIETMLADIEVARAIGVQGVVFAALTEEGHVHHDHCQRLLEAAGSLQTTFHRAFDTTVDPIASLDHIVRLGFTRLLTSGQAATAAEGIPLIRQLHRRGEGRIVLLPGGGVNSQNAQHIVEATGVRELHASAAVPAPSKSRSHVAFGTDRRVASAELVRAIRQSLA